MINRSLALSLGLLATVSLSLVGCGNSGSGTEEKSTGAAATGSSGSKPTAELNGSVTLDGSSTVFPIANVMGEDFMDANGGVKVTVNKSGTGSGMQKFSRGEIDIATASRPIEQKEVDALKAANIDFIEIPIAYDGVSVIVNKANPVAKLTPAQLKSAWSTAATVNDWTGLGGPAGKIAFYGPSDNHGTYEYFTEAIDGKKGDIRKDYQANQDYNVVVQSVAGDKNGIGYVGFNYYIENQDKVKAVPIDAGKGPIAPSEATIADGTYAPLSRPLFLYVSKKAYDRPEVKAFVDFAIGDGGLKAVKEAKYVPLPADALASVKKHVADGKTGSLFIDAKPGDSVTTLLGK